MYDMDDDHNKIIQIVAIKYIVKTIKLIIKIFIFVFLVGMIILLLTDSYDEYDTVVSDNPDVAYSTSHFWKEYSIKEQSPGYVLLIGIYYA